MNTVHENNRAEAARTDAAEIAQRVRDGVHPKHLKGRLKVAAETFMGNIPLGFEQPNKTMRKVIGGSWELLHVLKFGLLGGFLFLAGVAMWCAILLNKPGLKELAVSLGLIVLGVWSLRSGYKAYRAMRAISKA